MGQRRIFLFAVLTITDTDPTSLHRRQSRYAAESSLRIVSIHTADIFLTKIRNIIRQYFRRDALTQHLSCESPLPFHRPRQQSRIRRRAEVPVRVVHAPDAIEEFGQGDVGGARGLYGDARIEVALRLAPQAALGA